MKSTGRGNAWMQRDDAERSMKMHLERLSKAKMNKEIAARLNTSVRNVEKYVSRLFGKTETNSRTELVRFALKHGLTQY